MREEMDTNCVAIEKKEKGCHLGAIVYELDKVLAPKTANNKPNYIDRSEEIFDDKNDRYV